jgi:hypothetical protein
MPVSFCRFVSVGCFAGLLDPDYILGPIVECSYFIYLFHLSLSSISSPTLRADFYERAFKPGCALHP